MKKIILIPILFSMVIATAQTFDFNNTLDGWSTTQGSVTAVAGAEAVAVSYTIPAGVTNFSPKIITTTAAVDAIANSIMAITINTGTSDVSVIKLKHDRLATTGDRFVQFDITPNNNQFVTYYFDLENAEWNNNNTAPAIQNNFEILFRGAGDIPVTLDSTVQIDKIEFLSYTPRLTYTFDTDADLEGYNARNGATLAVASGIGNMVISGTNNSSQIRQEAFGVDATVNKYVHIRLKNNSPNDQLRFAFDNSDGTGRNFKNETITPNATDFEVITVNLSNNGEWNAESIVTDFDFRFRNTTNGNSAGAGTVKIDYILFSDSNNVTYQYANGAWTPTDPSGVSSFSENIVVNDMTTLSSSTQCNDLTINSNGNLSIGSGNTLNFKGSFVNNGTLDGTDGTLRISGSSAQTVDGNLITAGNVFVINTSGVTMNADVDLQGSLTLSEGVLDVTNSNFTFKSTATNSAIVAPVVNGSINGDVTVEQFYPANRSFRFMSSSVNMSGTIFDDWQQGGLNPGDAGYEAELGIQVTGGSIADGYDQSSSNAPSIFGFNNNYTDINNSWTTFTAPTNATSLNAGEALRVFVRGDRGVSLTTAGATATDTKLVTRGSIVTGPQSFAPSTTDGNYVFVGNPYQAQVDLNTVLTNSEDINTSTYYAWNPSMNNYVAYSFAMGGTQSGVSQFIQPGQSYFVLIADDGDANAPSVNYTEVDKSNSTATTATYSLPQAFITMTLENDQNISKDRLTLLFDDNGDNLITDQDAPKLKGTDEQLMAVTNGVQLAIDDRLTPVDQEVLQLNTENFTTGSYQFTVNASGFTIPAYLEDQFTGQFTLLDSSNAMVIPFSVDDTIAASSALDRFRIVFSNVTLGLNDSALANAISLYPNPVTSNSISIQGLPVNEIATINIYNISGQLISSQEAQTSNGGINNLEIPSLTNGIYMVNVAVGEFTTTVKLIKN